MCEARHGPVGGVYERRKALLPAAAATFVKEAVVLAETDPDTCDRDRLWRSVSVGLRLQTLKGNLEQYSI
jgi:hypothetical protein